MRIKPGKDIILMADGPMKGSFVSWYREDGPLPRAWNHVERESEVVKPDDAQKGVVICGEGRNAHGDRVLLTERRLWYRYSLTTEVGPKGCAVMRIMSAPVPLYWDEVTERFEDPSDYSDLEQSERFTLPKPKPDTLAPEDP